ncbi:hypothetical protein CAEBREN_12487 [Caenorhabditis brenneri]|uniref:PAN-3 domain-containing protein n=1 Tax=Caenorhabditis brenneri TaxID=135651 RepID=G0NSS1_CAEBE|nr:hypothetical protein CAEBREN_12487 [Caenorhabditis brenneri]
MMQVPDTVIDEPSGSSMDILTCVTGCLLDSECFLVYSKADGECIRLDVLTPYQVNVTSDGRFVAFKTNLTTCPTTYLGLSFSVIMPSGFTYSWTANSTSWSFTGCRDGWTRFDRADSVSVCMKIFLQNYIAYNTSREMCANQSAVLTGLASSEECKWVQARVFQLTATAWVGFWIDGVRNCTEGQTCQTFAWTDGYTTNYDVLYNSTNADLSISPATSANECCLTVGYISPQTINDINCAASLNLILGYVCGYKV